MLLEEADQNLILVQEFLLTQVPIEVTLLRRRKLTTGCRGDHVICVVQNENENWLIDDLNGLPRLRVNV